MAKPTIITLPAGRYYIGDPCYVFAEDAWDRLIENDLEGAVTFEGHALWAHYTAWGDGEYHDQRGHAYGVDSGTLAAVPEALVVRSSEDGHWLDAPNGLRVSYDGGTFCFNDVVIHTDMNGEEGTW